MADVEVSGTAGASSVAVTGSLPAGTNVIGHVIVDSAGNVSVTSLPALPAGTNVIGHVIVDSAGSVAVTALPALPTGSNTIGAVTGPSATPLAQESGGNLAAILAKLSGDPATQTTLAAILAKQPAAPALESGNLATLVTQTVGLATDAHLATLAGTVSAGKCLVTETSAAATLSALTAGQKTSATSQSVTFPSDKALASVATAADGSLYQTTNMIAVPLSGGGAVLAGAAGRRIFSIWVTNFGNAATTYVLFTNGAPSGTYPNYTNLFAGAIVGANSVSNASGMISNIMTGGGYPSGSTSVYAVSSTSPSSIGNPTAAPMVALSYGP